MLKGRHQYSLWHLFALVAAVAVLLGSWRVIGAKALLIPVAAAMLALVAVRRPQRLCVWLLPVIWTAVAWTNFAYPGDEYGGFAVGSLAGIWILRLIQFTSDPLHMLPLVLVAGAATVAVAGFLMDKLRVPWAPWIVLMLGAATAFFLRWFGSFPSVERALSKNGSYEAYVLPSINMGLYAATITMLVGTGLYRLTQWFRNNEHDETQTSSSGRSCDLATGAGRLSGKAGNSPRPHRIP